MKVLLVKRLESSFEAFRLTLARFIHAYDRFISALRRGEVFVSKKKTALIFDLIEAGDLEAIESIIEGGEAERYIADDFTGAFLSDLENDWRVLSAIQADWENIYRDPKWEKVKSLLQTDAVFSQSKLLLFTESKETAEYLSKRITDELDEPTLCFTGSSKKSLREEVILNFDARIKDARDDFRILVTTDTLAEGVSLHRAHVVVNYDIPWNPTRMMQRVGRINRVDTEFDRIFTYNFFPSEEGEEEIGLQASAEAKIEAFIEMLGADARLLTENEEIKSFNLFARITAKETLTGETETAADSELKYLQVIRDVQDNNPRLFDRIKRLPRKCRTARHLPDYSNALLTYFRFGKLDKFYLSAANNSAAQELDFLAAVKILQSDDAEKRGVGEGFFTLAEKNRNALERELQLDHETVYAPASNRDAATKLLRRLHIFKRTDFQNFTEEEEQLWQHIIQTLESGALAKMTLNRVLKALERVGDARGTLEVLKKQFSLEDLTNINVAGEETYNVQPLAKPREVVLSVHLLE
jgi:superfamily II DNA/RNA helicase